jgi:aminopeptidase N
MNVTRAEAQARARLLDVEGYDVVLDLTIGDVTFGSTTTARFRCTEPGAETFVDLVADRIDEITLNGRPGPGDGLRRDPHHPHRPGRDNELVVRASCRYMHTGEGCTASSTRSTSPSTCTRSSRSPTRAGCSPSSSSPT